MRGEREERRKYGTCALKERQSMSPTNYIMLFIHTFLWRSSSTWDSLFDEKLDVSSKLHLFSKENHQYDQQSQFLFHAYILTRVIYTLDQRMYLLSIDSFMVCNMSLVYVVAIVNATKRKFCMKKKQDSNNKRYLSPMPNTSSTKGNRTRTLTFGFGLCLDKVYDIMTTRIFDYPPPNIWVYFEIFHILD